MSEKKVDCNKPVDPEIFFFGALCVDHVNAIGID